MNPKLIFNLFSSKKQDQAVVRSRISSLIISTVMLSLVALTSYAGMVQASGPQPDGQPSLEMLRSIDPADRKFFTPGYGTQVVMLEKVEVLPIVDSADRKFFIPGYGVMSGESKEAEVLPIIDPADRKFFQPSLIFFQK